WETRLASARARVRAESGEASAASSSLKDKNAELRRKCAERGYAGHLARAGSGAQSLHECQPGRSGGALDRLGEMPVGRRVRTGELDGAGAKGPRRGTPPPPLTDISPIKCVEHLRHHERPRREMGRQRLE